MPSTVLLPDMFSKVIENEEKEVKITEVKDEAEHEKCQVKAEDYVDIESSFYWIPVRHTPALSTDNVLLYRDENTRYGHMSQTKIVHAALDSPKFCLPICARYRALAHSKSKSNGCFR